MTRKIQLSPSLMTMDLDQFKEQITFLNDKVNSFHIDVMDGHFVPNITLSPWFVEQVRKISDVPMSAHMMVMDAPFWVDRLIEVKCDYICFPSEVANGVAFSMIDKIHAVPVLRLALCSTRRPQSMSSSRTSICSTRSRS